MVTCCIVLLIWTTVLPSLLIKIYQVKYSKLIFLAKYYPRTVAFTNQFLGGNFHDTGLNTNKTPSRVHNNFDQWIIYIYKCFK